MAKKVNWRSFGKARDFVHKLRLKNAKKWFTWTKSSVKPEDIPANPAGVYKDKGWIS